MIGTQDNAEIAVLLCSTEYGDKPPNGWEILGSGIDRTAYLGPDSVVYKVTHTLSRPQANVKEHEACQILGSGPKPEGFGVPESALFDVEDTKVIAMEFLGDDDNAVYLTAAQTKIAQEFYKNTDTHGGNMRSVEGVIYMIDIAFFDPNAGNAGAGCQDSCCVKRCGGCDEKFCCC